MRCHLYFDHRGSVVAEAISESGYQFDFQGKGSSQYRFLFGKWVFDQWLELITLMKILLL